MSTPGRVVVLWNSESSALVDVVQRLMSRPRPRRFHNFFNILPSCQGSTITLLSEFSPAIHKKRSRASWCNEWTKRNERPLVENVYFPPSSPSHTLLGVCWVQYAVKLLLFFFGEEGLSDNCTYRTYLSTPNMYNE